LGAEYEVVQLVKFSDMLDAIYEVVRLIDFSVSAQRIYLFYLPILA